MSRLFSSAATRWCFPNLAPQRKIILKSLLQIVFVLCLWIVPGLAHAQKLEHAVLAYGSTGPNLTPFWVAREAGLNRHYGLDVDVVFFRGSTIAINALATRDA